MSSIFPTTNLLLASLDTSTAEGLQPYLTRVPLSHREVLAEPETPIPYAYFLEDGIASVVNMFEDGSESEIGVFGHEGMSAPSIALGVNQTPCRVYMQLDGTRALRIATHDLASAMNHRPALATIVCNYAQVAAIQAGNTAAVNAHFGIPRRLARWLLMCHDRVIGDELPITHEMLAIMLGVRRPGVTVALNEIEEQGVIASSRGRTTVVDREGLERLAGSAYGTSEKEYRRLLGPFGKGLRHNQKI
ncbi:Crp/Fnr family transcriptional regulator [Sphingomonas paeninsulae]|uniref:Crp/Fnr family transcriptional regulator n=1 Tax=Sphingomonas paeninsulae TaxID=2319844 RepID=A0A494TIX0_SPHPE|nr:Crp/Fnr family transcriptional regulator [Sphingomonas paeninsulae]AYJ87444.1 Crp/Fnr family transcriptional regulator [Sphingomonas paeninsulae]